MVEKAEKQAYIARLFTILIPNSLKCLQKGDNLLKQVKFHLLHTELLVFTQGGYETNQRPRKTIKIYKCK